MLDCGRSCTFDLTLVNFPKAVFSWTRRLLVAGIRRNRPATLPLAEDAFDVAIRVVVEREPSQVSLRTFLLKVIELLREKLPI